tara:strand:- start:44 stop:508 length:465 start_codon:yes stop_codon:yes gene_type:complete
MVGNLKSQQGFVLIVALVFLIALTAVASALMLNTTTDMKMSGASQEKVIATQEALSAIDEVILIQTRGATNLFRNTLFPVNGIPVAVTHANTAAVITHTNPMSTDVTCPHRVAADNLFNCNMLRVTLTKNYGNNDTSSVTVNAGVSQDVLKLTP